MSLSILQLGPYPPPEGGISRNMLAIRDEARSRGHKCWIAATSKSSHIVNEPDVFHPASAFALARLLATLKYDVLHLHIGGDITRRVLLLVFACAFFGRNKSILTLHSGAYPITQEGLSAAPNSVRGCLFRRFSQIIAVNDLIADVFHRYGIVDDRIQTILPYSLKWPDKNIKVPDALEVFCKSHSPLLLAVGGLEKDYDPLFQIKAMKVILQVFPNAGLMIVGDGSIRGEAERMAAESGYAPSVLLAGNVAHAVTLHLINCADILLRTTLFDGDAISVREALHFGTPVIATDNGMRPEDVCLIGIGDSTALVESLKKMVADGRKMSTEKKSDNTNIVAVVDLYEKLS